MRENDVPFTRKERCRTEKNSTFRERKSSERGKDVHLIYKVRRRIKKDVYSKLMERKRSERENDVHFT